MAPTGDTDTIFSDATFDTLSRHSAVSENVVYADIVKPGKAWIKELTTDDEMNEEDEIENEEPVANPEQVNAAILF